MFGLNSFGKIGVLVRSAFVAAAWSPLSLFANSEVGAWYDPSDLTTMFQDRAGIMLVTADGQTVGKILDKSGRGNHAVAPSDAARPLYKTDGTYHWLQFDGVDDSLSTAAINFTSTDKMSVFAAIARAGESIGNQGVVALGSVSTDAGSFEFQLYTNGNTPLCYRRANGGFGARSIPAVSTAKHVYGICLDLAGTTQATENPNFRVDGAQGASFVEYGSGDTGAGTFGSYIMYVGTNAIGQKLLGNIYSLIVRGALSTTQEITDTETWVNSKTGAF